MWADWIRREYRVLLLFALFVLLLGAYIWRRLHPGATDAVSLEFLNDCTTLTLGALIGVLSERLAR